MIVALSCVAKRRVEPRCEALRGNGLKAKRLFESLQINRRPLRRFIGHCPDNLFLRQMLDHREIGDSLVGVPQFTGRNVIGTLQRVFEGLATVLGGAAGPLHRFFSGVFDAGF